MVIGESRHFTVEAPSGVDISGYTARYELMKDNRKISEASITNTGTGFKVKISTTGFQAGAYEVRVFITDPTDGFVQVITDKFQLFR